jgi:hypothetical protein
MKYLKKFNESEDLIKNIKELGGKVRQLRHAVESHRREFTKKEILEDYFLEFKESEMFYIDIEQQFWLITVKLYNSLDKDRIEEEYNRILNKLISVKDRFEKIEGFQCHFDIKLGGLSQGNLNQKTNKNDDYKYKGFGDKKFGYLGNKWIHYDDTNNWPDDKVPISIDFFIV